MREFAWSTVNRLSRLRGNDTIPTEDVIDLAQALKYVLETVDGPNPEEEAPKQVQTSGPQCKNCGAFTTKKRVETHGLCMKCEREAKQ